MVEATLPKARRRIPADRRRVGRHGEGLGCPDAPDHLLPRLGRTGRGQSWWGRRRGRLRGVRPEARRAGWPAMTWWLRRPGGSPRSGHCLGMCGGLVSGCFLRLGPRARRPAAHAAYQPPGWGCTPPSRGGGGIRRTADAERAIRVRAGGAPDRRRDRGRLSGPRRPGPLTAPRHAAFAPSAWIRTLFSRAVAMDSASAGARPASAWRGALLAGLAKRPDAMRPHPGHRVQATTTRNAAAGALLMIAFGAGTLPSMLAAGILFERLSETSRGTLLKAAAALIVLMGVPPDLEGADLHAGDGKLVL